MLVVLVSLGGLLLASPLALRAWVDWRYKDRVYSDIAEVPPRRVALVFGAGVWPGGTLSHILADRVDTAVDLYQAGKVQKLLMSGDNRFIDYNEPQHMQEYAVARGVPEADIVLDYAGRRTYDSCYRARAIFGVEEVVLVTQEYHIDRALFTCNGVGLDAVGVVADRRSYIKSHQYWLREIPAMALAWWDVTVAHPLPVLGEPIPIE
ncbi:MAG: ElyC/SanA/YdcF family protein [Chloroflexota bacterium]|nr:ElyC/SanA/YdcF family protein [Chloroflexota bacterium]